MAEGTIKKLIADKGFGFIQGEKGELFFHHSAVENAQFDTLQEGQRVTYTEGRGPKGPRADAVTPVYVRMTQRRRVRRFSRKRRTPRKLLSLRGVSVFESEMTADHTDEHGSIQYVQLNDLLLCFIRAIRAIRGSLAFV
jgi:CspA family cold shock protein